MTGSNTLYESCLQVFDELVSKCLVKFHSSTATVYPVRGRFELSLRYTPWLQGKPVVDSESPKVSRNPFLDPDPRFIVPCPVLDEAVQPTHRLLINLFPVYRPQLLVTTIEEKSQATNLDESDLTAAQGVLEQLSSQHDGLEWMAIYNCGRHSGNSQPHKHLQVFPVPDATNGADIVFFPEAGNAREHLQEIRAPSTNSTALKCYADLEVPYVHFLARFGPDGSDASHFPSVQQLQEAYISLLSHTDRVLAHAAVPAPSSYNMVLTRRWMLLIPRRASCGKGTGTMDEGPMVNAIGMAGAVWVSRQEVIEQWLQCGFAQHLEACGLGWSEVQID